MTSMYIRMLDGHDAEAYRELRLYSLQESPEAFLSDYETERERPVEVYRERLLATPDNFTLGGFNEQGRLVGMVTFIRENRSKIRHKGTLYSLYVAPEARGQRLGRALLSEALSKASKCPGVERINLTVMADNGPAIRLYTSLGFSCYGTERSAVKVNGGYRDEDLMVYELKSWQQPFV